MFYQVEQPTLNFIGYIPSQWDDPTERVFQHFRQSVITARCPLTPLRTSTQAYQKFAQVEVRRRDFKDPQEETKIVGARRVEARVEDAKRRKGMRGEERAPRIPQAHADVPDEIAHGEAQHQSVTVRHGCCNTSEEIRQMAQLDCNRTQDMLPPLKDKCAYIEKIKHTEDDNNAKQNPQVGHNGRLFPLTYNTLYTRTAPKGVI